MQARTRELWDLFAQAPHDVIQRQQRALAEGDDDSFLGRRQHRASRIARSHPRVRRRRARPPFVDRRPAQPVALGEDARLLFRRLEFGSNSRRCSGAAVKNACHDASSALRLSLASRLPGTKHLGLRLLLERDATHRNRVSNTFDRVPSIVKASTANTVAKLILRNMQVSSLKVGDF